MKRVNHLWEKLISDENLTKAIIEVNNGHHWLKGHKPNRCTAWVEETFAERKAELKKILEEGFVPKQPKVSKRWDASARKWREICEPRLWPDQYVHHALIQVLQPVMMRGMDKYCCGSIKGRGTHYGMKSIKCWVQKDVKGTKYCLSVDIHHFYQSLHPDIVMNRMKQLVKDGKVLDLIEIVVKDGVQIGAYTSQWFANTLLQPLDNLIRQHKITHYLRYMDNFTVFGTNKRKLHELKNSISVWLKEHLLEIKDDWQIFPVNIRMPTALGYRYGRTYVVPRKHNLFRMKRGVNSYRRKKSKHKAYTYHLAAGLISRLGMLGHCNNYQLYAQIYKGERIVKQLKTYVRLFSKGGLESWSMYLARRKRKKFFAPKAMPTAI